MKLENLEKLVNSYLLTPNSKYPGENLYLKRLKQLDGNDQWFIGNDSERCSLNSRLLLFCLETSDSNKDKSFLKEHRFSSKEAALDVLKQYLECDWSTKKEFKDLTEKEFTNFKRQRDRYKEGLADIF